QSCAVLRPGEVEFPGLLALRLHGPFEPALIVGFDGDFLHGLPDVDGHFGGCIDLHTVLFFNRLLLIPSVPQWWIRERGQADWPACLAFTITLCPIRAGSLPRESGRH